MQRYRGKRLNLLPQSLLDKYEYDKFLKQTAICMAVVFLSIILIVMCLKFTNGRLEESYTYYREKLEDERFAVAEEASRVMADLSRGADYVMKKGVREGMTDITGAVPSEIYAWSISYSHEQSGVYTFYGIAENRWAIPVFERRVRSMERFSEVEVSVIRLDGGDSGLISFTLVCRVG